jgi:hypothetical protein
VLSPLLSFAKKKSEKFFRRTVLCFVLLFISDFYILFFYGAYNILFLSLSFYYFALF